MFTKRLLLPIILVIMLTGLVLFGPGDTNTLVGDTSVSDNGVAGNVSEPDDRDASTATITIIMKTGPA